MIIGVKYNFKKPFDQIHQVDNSVNRTQKVLALVSLYKTSINATSKQINLSGMLRTT